MMKLKWLFIGLLVINSSSCEKENIIPKHSPPALMELPKGFDSINAPIDNLFTTERWKLGKRLFYDPVMSVDSSISCASCHQPELGFSDNVALSHGVMDRIGTRNSPSLVNIGYHPYFTREGGVPTLEGQILVPIQEHNEFDFNIVLLAEKLILDSSYTEMSLSAYNQVINPYTITRSLACFERSLISGYSPYDQFENYNDQSALTESELRGMNLFFSNKTNCSSCHDGFNFTNYAFENNGLYTDYTDPGRYKLTGLEEDRARFKVPSLRNIELSGPYMHDGSIDHLSEVIEHYNNGGQEHKNKNALVKPLGLTQNEKNDLLAFLKSLTDVSFINNEMYR